MLDPMRDYTINKLKYGIKALRSLDKYTDYAAYAPEIVESMLHDVEAYLEYLTCLSVKERPEFHQGDSRE